MTTDVEAWPHGNENLVNDHFQAVLTFLLLDGFALGLLLLALYLVW